MFHILLALHVLLAVFAVGPLVHAATTAGRGIRHGDGFSTAYAARVIRIYSYASTLVVVLGFGLMSVKQHGKTVAQFGDTWVWVSLLLWLAAASLSLVVVVPTLERATTLIDAEQSVVTLTARVAAAGGVIGLLFTAIIFLMVYRPGS